MRQTNAPETNNFPGLGCFFAFMTVAEGGGRRAVVRKFQDVYVPALKANFLIWPAVQMLNFRVIPIQFQIVSFRPRSTSTAEATANNPEAFCVHRRYRLDRLPLPHQLGRGSHKPLGRLVFRLSHILRTLTTTHLFAYTAALLRRFGAADAPHQELLPYTSYGVGGV